MSGIHCPFCPFAGCIWCEHKGGDNGTPIDEEEED